MRILTACRLPFAALLLAGCSVGPNYVRPSAPTPVAYKELKGWTISKPLDGVPKGAWWSVFHDPLLDQLESRVQIDNQSVKAAAAAYEEARALVAEGRSQLFPTATLNSSIVRASGSPPTTDVTAQADASWAPDLWGRVRRTIESEKAGAQASAADLQNATLLAQAALAADYFDLREADSLQALLESTVAEYKRSLQITQNQFKAGTTAGSDVVTAQTQLLTAQAQAINVGVARAQFEHAIAVLTGRPPAELTVPRGRLSGAIPTVPAGVPSTLLERRPDIAAAERRVKQENALIGVAVAGYYPNLTLSGLVDYAGDPFSGILKSSNLVWSLGASGSQTLFNGFLTQAQVRAARAAYEQSVATYRQSVLTAFQQVEDELAAIRILRRQAVAEDAAERSAQRSVTIALNEYRAGSQAYTAVVTAQAAALQNEESALTIRLQRTLALVSLIEDLGGGWSAADLPAG